MPGTMMKSRKLHRGEQLSPTSAARFWNAGREGSLAGERFDVFEDGIVQAELYAVVPLATRAGSGPAGQYTAEQERLEGCTRTLAARHETFSAVLEKFERAPTHYAALLLAAWRGLIQAFAAPHTCSAPVIAVHTRVDALIEQRAIVRSRGADWHYAQHYRHFAYPEEFYRSDLRPYREVAAFFDAPSAMRAWKHALLRELPRLVSERLPADPRAT